MSQTFARQLRFARPRLSTKARLQTDRASGEPVLLYPEGVVLLNTTGAEIVRLCDGAHTFAEILAQLAEKYHTPAEQLEHDVSTCLFKLHQQSLLELPAGEIS